MQTKWTLASVIALSRQIDSPEDPEARRVWRIARGARITRASRDSLLAELEQEAIHVEL